MLVPSQIVDRDNRNAHIAQTRSHEKLRQSHPNIFIDDITGGLNEANKAQIDHFTADHKSLVAVRNYPFHAMVEVDVVVKGGKSRKALWYAHENIKTMQMLGDVVVLPWTHPGIQKALVEDLNDEQDIDDPRYTIIEVTPRSRALFEKLFPEIVGIYDPYGRVGELIERKKQTGLKAVKLQMTKDQVRAFTSKMKGILYVTGAPGSGKTTVAFQRMRFLFDVGEQQSEVVHTPETSKVFLANQNLIDHSRRLLEKQLEIPPAIVSLVSEFVEEYLDDAWCCKNDALFLFHEIKNTLSRRAREAFFSTCVVSDLNECWSMYEVQIVERLLEAQSSEWAQSKWQTNRNSKVVENLVVKLHEFAKKNHKTPPASEPLSSEVTIGKLYSYCAKEYETLRDELSKNEVKKFDGLIQKWLFYSYDPLEAITRYFSGKFHEGALRVRKGTGSRVDEENVIEQIKLDFGARQYRREEMAWLAWLLRFVLPTEDDPKNKFREIPCAYSPIIGKYGPWNHVVIDEAQDLSVVEASLISSFVVKNGALTISADFKQVVSPVHGMENPNAFKIGCNLIGRKDDLQLFPFSKNMRQTSQIGNFLRSFYHRAFGEIPNFIANHELNGPKPHLRIMPYTQFAATIKAALNTLKHNKFSGTVALIQINEDEDEMNRYRELLENAGVDLAPMWASDSDSGYLITSSVERIKGLEYDICIVVGLEKAEESEMNYNLSRAYVAISRPTQRLLLLCENFPALLKNVNSELFDVYDLRPTR